MSSMNTLTGLRSGEMNFDITLDDQILDILKEYNLDKNDFLEELNVDETFVYYEDDIICNKARIKMIYMETEAYNMSGYLKITINNNNVVFDFDGVEDIYNLKDHYNFVPESDVDDCLEKYLNKGNI